MRASFQEGLLSRTERIELVICGSMAKQKNQPALAEGLRQSLFSVALSLSTSLDSHFECAQVMFELQINSAFRCRKNNIYYFFGPGNFVDFCDVLINTSVFCMLQRTVSIPVGQSGPGRFVQERVGEHAIPSCVLLGTSGTFQMLHTKSAERLNPKRYFTHPSVHAVVF
jgi:hypothetical protein